MQNLYLSDKQLAERYAVTRGTVWRWKREESFPQPIKLAGSTRWRLQDIEAWEQSQLEVGK